MIVKYEVSTTTVRTEEVTLSRYLISSILRYQDIDVFHNTYPKFDRGEQLAEAFDKIRKFSNSNASGECLYNDLREKLIELAVKNIKDKELFRTDSGLSENKDVKEDDEDDEY